MGDRTQLDSAPNLSLLELLAKTATGTLDKTFIKKIKKCDRDSLAIADN
ncbi:hypothetical protein [Microcoleus vaginatus]